VTRNAGSEQAKQSRGELHPERVAQVPGSQRYRCSQELFDRATAVIPLGIYGHKNPEGLLPGASPYYAAKGRGGHCWDVDGHEYIDFLCGYGPVILGHAHPVVEQAVVSQMAEGNCLNHPGSLMVELAERLVSLVDMADWAVFAKNGSDVTTWATRVAREHTGRPKIVMVRDTYHGAQAWCLPGAGGLLPEDRAHVLQMEWNRLDLLEQFVEEHPGQIAGVIMAPYHHPIRAPQEMPGEGFWPGVRALCYREGMVLILDDIRAGFRLNLHGSHAVFGIEPDLVCFAKAMGNGHPISAAVGRAELRDAAERVFLSGTYWFSPAPMAAALTTLRVLEETDAIPRMARLGQRLARGLEERGAAHRFEVVVSGPPALPYLTFQDDPDLHLMRLFCREMISRGVFLHPHHNWFLCAAHTDHDIDRTLGLADIAFAQVAREMV
jgi:glutamate-1-semialdehyde 2,1-aminomutase